MSWVKLFCQGISVFVMFFGSMPWCIILFYNIILLYCIWGYVVCCKWGCTVFSVFSKVCEFVCYYHQYLAISQHECRGVPEQCVSEFVIE